jgi:hypothetical protein
MIIVETSLINHIPTGHPHRWIEQSALDYMSQYLRHLFLQVSRFIEQICYLTDRPTNQTLVSRV